MAAPREGLQRVAGSFCGLCEEGTTESEDDKNPPDTSGKPDPAAQDVGKRNEAETAGARPNKEDGKMSEKSFKFQFSVYSAILPYVTHPDPM